MSLFRKDKPPKNSPSISKQKELEKLLKEREKKEKKIRKAWEKRLDYVYTDKELKAANNVMLERAYNIDSMQYEKMVRELRENLHNNSIPDENEIQLPPPSVSDTD